MLPDDVDSLRADSRCHSTHGYWYDERFWCPPPLVIACHFDVISMRPLLSIEISRSGSMYSALRRAGVATHVVFTKIINNNNNNASPTRDTKFSNSEEILVLIERADITVLSSILNTSWPA